MYMFKEWTEADEAEEAALRYKIVRLKAGAVDGLPAGTEGVVVCLYPMVLVDGPVSEKVFNVFIKGHGVEPDEDYGSVRLPEKCLEMTDMFDEEKRQALLNARLWTEAEKKALLFRVVRLKPDAVEGLPAGIDGVIINLHDATTSEAAIPAPYVSVLFKGHDIEPGEEYSYIDLPLESLEVTDMIDEEARQASLNPMTMRVSQNGEILGFYDEDGEFVPHDPDED